MITKPILFWPRPLAEVETMLHSAPGEFLVVDTNSIYELQKLYKIAPGAPIFDPFPRHGDHYREFHDHIVASRHRLHIAGLKACQGILEARRDPSLAHASIEELLAALGPMGREEGAWHWPALHAKASLDWSRLSWPSTAVAVVLVFIAALAGSLLFPGNALIAAGAAALLFAVLYVAVRIDWRGLRPSALTRRNRAA